ncbi:MAG: GNAT family N-acetyltransferase [Cyanobacteria bacterium P01_A01_bin.135]
MQKTYQNFVIRPWQPGDRQKVAQLLSQVLGEFGLEFDPDGADQDAVQVEAAYQDSGGEFWVVEQDSRIVGSGGYRPYHRGERGAELRKMYLLPEVRGQGLGRFLLRAIEEAAAQRGFTEMWLETANSLKGAIALYERNGYLPDTGVETQRCDRIYVKPL